MIEAGIIDGDQLGTRADVGRGMGVSRTLHLGNLRPKWAQTHQPSHCSGWNFLDRPHRIARTGSPWRDLPGEFGKWSSVYRQFRRWTPSGLWEQIMEALNESPIVPDTLQMIDSTVIRAPHQAAGAKGGLRDRVLAARARQSGKRSTGSFSCPPSTSRPRSTSASMVQACQ